MKLRLQGNSIRLRLNRDEVAQLSENGRVEDAAQFAEGTTLAYAVELSKETTHPRALFLDNTIRITLPMEDAQDWARSDRVGIAAQDQPLSILIEKDFQCLQHPDPHAYPNPAFPDPDAAHH